MAVTEAPVRAPVAKTKKASSNEDHGRLAGLLLTPTMAVLLIVIGYPILAATYQSLFTQNQGVDESGFVQQGDKFSGLDNYTAVFSGAAADPFWNVVSALLWRWIFDANGIANTIINQQILWSTDGWQAKAAVIIADTWKTAPFIGLLVLAGLQVIPTEVYEAAKIDGASAVKQFWHITLPLVKPALLVAVLFRILDNLRMFDLPYVLVGSQKPSVETISILAFLENDNARFGSAAAFAVILFLYIVVVAYAFVKLIGADLIGDARVKTPKGANRRRPIRNIARGDTP
jgi:multiple sugar transport system permease protein